MRDKSVAPPQRCLAIATSLKSCSGLSSFYSFFYCKKVARSKSDMSSLSLNVVMMSLYSLSSLNRLESRSIAMNTVYLLSNSISFAATKDDNPARPAPNST